MSALTWQLLVDWDGDGLVETDEADRMVGIQVQRGRPRQFSTTGYERMRVGKANITLDNYDDRFTSWNTGSPLYPDVLPRRAVRIKVTNGATTYDVMWGFIRDIKLSGPRGDRASLIVEDGWRWLKDRAAPVDTRTNITTGAAIALLLEAAQWPAPNWRLGEVGYSELGLNTYITQAGGTSWSWDRDIDTGRDTIPFWWGSNESAYTQLHQVAESESGFIYVAADGTFVFQDRDHMYNTSAAFTLTQAEVLKQITVGQPFNLVWNQVQVNVNTRIQGSTAELWKFQGSAFLVRAGNSVNLCASYSPAINVLTPVATTDYTANSQPGGGGTDLTGNVTVTMLDYGTSADLTVTNTGGIDAYITLLRVRGDPLTLPDTTPVAAIDQTSIDAFGPRLLALDLEWQQDFEESTQYAFWLLSWLSNPQPEPSVHVERRDIQFAHDLGTYLDFTSAKLGLSETYRLGYISHRSLDNACQKIVTEWRLERINAQEFWLLGTVGRSELGQTTKVGF